MKKRGVIYVVWESSGGIREGMQIPAFLERSIKSLQQYHPELPHEVVTLPAGSQLIDKAGLYDFSPYESTLFLDADTVVLGRLDFGFEMAERFGLACCLSENPWQRRYVGVVGDAVEYNTGVLFFSDKAKHVFDSWKRLAPLLDSRIAYHRQGRIETAPCDDQLGFARSVELCAFVPFVLPLNWNFRPMWHRSFFGPIKIWHGYADVPELLVQVNRYYENPGAIMQFHEMGGSTLQS